MTYPTGYNPSQLSPEVFIYDHSNVLKYTFQTSTTQGSPTQDFKLTDLTFTNEGDGAYGHAILIIQDNDGALIDKTELRRRSKIKRQWNIQIYLGKNNAGLSRWFYGKIMNTSIIRPGTNLQSIILQCTGWGEMLKNKITTIIRNQDKGADGIDLDDTDVKTRLDNLILDMFEDTDHYFDENIKAISTITAAIDPVGICDECLDIKIANVNELGNSFAGFISRMVGVANASWHIDYDRKIIVRDTHSHDSGFLFTNSLTDLDTVGWDKGKLGFLLENPISWRDESFESMYSWIHGFGHFAPSLDIHNDPTVNSSDNMDDEWIAIPFTPTVDNVFKVAIKMSRTGTPPNISDFRIHGDNAGDPDPNDIRRTIKLSKESLGKFATGTPTNWIEFPISPKLLIEPNTPLHLVFPQYGNSSNTFNIGYESGTGSYKVSSDGISWSGATGDIALRIYSAKRLRTSVENTRLSQLFEEPREKLIPIRADLEEQTVRQALIQAALVLGKERRVYEDVVITATDDRIPLSSFCRLKDVKTGLDIKAGIVSYTVEMHGGDIDSNLGADRITLTLDDIHAA